MIKDLLHSECTLLREKRKSMKKTLILASLALAAAATLTGCASTPTAPGSVNAGDAQVWTNAVNTPLGAVDCVFYDGNESGAVQCDWANVGSAKAATSQNSGVTAVKQVVSGKPVDCVTFDTNSGGGISCNLPSVQK
jgi:hypothetical protein